MTIEYRMLDSNWEMGQHFEQGRNMEDAGGNLETPMQFFSH